VSETTQDAVTHLPASHHYQHQHQHQHQHQTMNVFSLKQPPSHESPDESHFNDEEYTSQTPLIR
jgi:hypothetical protein